MVPLVVYDFSAIVEMCGHLLILNQLSIMCIAPYNSINTIQITQTHFFTLSHYTTMHL